MELVIDVDGFFVVCLGEVELEVDQVCEFYCVLVCQVVWMLCCGFIYGDLLLYNVLVGLDGLVVIDFLQVVNVGGNNVVCSMLLCDVNNFIVYFGCFVLELFDIWYGEEMWVLFEVGDLLLDSELIGIFVYDEFIIDLDSVCYVINDVCEEVLICQQGCEVVEEDDL